MGCTTVEVTPAGCSADPCATGCPDATACGKCGNPECESNYGVIMAVIGIGLLGGLVMMSSGGSTI